VRVVSSAGKRVSMRSSCSATSIGVPNVVSIENQRRRRVLPPVVNGQEPMRKQVEAWQRSELTDVTAKVVIYEAFVEGRLEGPKSGRGRFGVCRMHSLRRSKNLTPFRNSRPRPSWASPWRTEILTIVLSQTNLTGCEKNSECRRSVWEWLRSVEEAFRAA